MTISVTIAKCVYRIWLTFFVLVVIKALDNDIADISAGEKDVEQEVEIGKHERLDQRLVDFKLIMPREKFVVGEIWSVFGELHNRSDKPI